MLVLLSTCYNSYGMIAYFPSVFEGLNIPPGAQYLGIVVLIIISVIIAFEIGGFMGIIRDTFRSKVKK